MNKYGNKRTEVDGYTFASRGEANRYQELRLEEKAGDVKELELQVRFPIKVNGVLICTYIADFVYWRLDTNEPRINQVYHYIVEDFKGYRTREYELKKKLVKATLGVDIQEVT